MIFIIVVVVVCGGGGFFLLFAKSGGIRKLESGQATPKAESVMFSLDPFIVNLSDSTNNKFLKVTMELELSEQSVIERAKARTPQIRDAVIDILTSQTYDSLMLPEGKLELKDNITMIANQTLGDKTVKNVYFTEFVMQ